MTNKLVAAFACLGFISAANAAEVNFDKGIDVKSVIEQAASTDVKAPYPYYGPHRVRYSKECQSFSFAASEFAQASNRAYLSSTEYIEDCHFRPNPPPPPVVNPPKPPKPPVNPQHPPKPGHNKNINDGPHGDYSYSGSYGNQQGTWYCRERIGQTFRATAQLNIAPRQLFPWETESFEVCMQADRVDFNTRQSPYSYSVDRQGLYDLTFNLTPSYRVPTAPDSNGLNAVGFSFKDGKFTLNVSDRWAREYAGEKVVIKVELIKDGFLFFNSSQGEKEFTLDVNAGYDMTFAAGELTKTKAFVDDSIDRGPKKYFVKWGFRRVGRISNGDFIKKGDTDKIPG